MSSRDTWLNVLTGISQGSFDKIYLRDASGNMVDLLTLLGSLGSVTDVISNSSELVVTTNGTTKILTLNLGGYVTSTALTNALAAYTDTTALTTFLGAKQNTLTAGTGIAISGATISSTHTPIILQLDGTTQSGATTLNFVGNNASFASNVLNISRMAWQDALTLRYSNSASDKNLSQGSAGELLWNGLEVQLRQNAFHQINVAAPLTVSGSNSITLDTLWKPSTVTVGTGIQAVASDANGTLQLNLTGTESRSQLKLIDSQNVVRSIVPSITGALTYNSSTLVDLTYLSSNFSTTASVNTSLAAKQPTLTTGAGTFLNGATISSYTLRWNGSSTPSVATAIQELHWDNYTMTETVNIGTGKIELTIGHPTDMATQTWTNTQLALKANDNEVSTAFAGVQVQLAAKAETSAMTSALAGKQAAITGDLNVPGTCNVTQALTTPSLKVNFPGGNGRLHVLGDASLQTEVLLRTEIGYGQGDAMTVHKIGGGAYVGIRNYYPSEALHVGGNILASGSITGSTKSFDITHEGREGYRLRHWCMEGDVPGGSLLYKRSVIADKAGVTDLIMPSWFGWLAKDVMVFCNGFRHHGTAWGERDELDPCVIHLNVSKGGIYNIMVTADRNDVCATTMCPQQIEYIPEKPEEPPPPFPTV